jgi:putative transposase
MMFYTRNMKLVANLKLVSTKEQSTALLKTLRITNDACNAISTIAFDARSFGQYALHKATYYRIKKQFSLSAQMVVRCIAKVSDAYAKDRTTLRRFRPDSAQPYDDRILRFCANDTVSIWVLGGRIKIPFQCGEHQRLLLEHRKGEIDLMRVKGVFYLACVCDVDDPKLIETTDVLGVDLGMVNIAADSMGKVYSGKAINRVRCTYAHRRRNLQHKETRSATRKLVTIKGRQARFQKDVNHVISKTIVSDAQRTASAIALEDLGGIRTRVTARRHQRARLSNWAFAQLRTFIGYKAARHGIPVILVDPRNTSLECPSCGHIDPRNRTTRNEFVCVQCGLAGPADTIAAQNIRARALVNAPMVARDCAA